MTRMGFESSIQVFRQPKAMCALNHKVTGNGLLYMMKSKSMLASALTWILSLYTT
jgi:hypothetical protein